MMLIVRSHFLFSTLNWELKSVYVNVSGRLENNPVFFTRLLKQLRNFLKESKLRNEIKLKVDVEEYDLYLNTKSLTFIPPLFP